jgi:hypothetical protein
MCVRWVDEDSVPFALSLAVSRYLVLNVTIFSSASFSLSLSLSLSVPLFFFLVLLENSHVTLQLVNPPVCATLFSSPQTSSKSAWYRGQVAWDKRDKMPKRVKKASPSKGLPVGDNDVIGQGKGKAQKEEGKRELEPFF